MGKLTQLEYKRDSPISQTRSEGFFLSVIGHKTDKMGTQTAFVNQTRPFGLQRPCRASCSTTVARGLPAHNHDSPTPQPVDRRGAIHGMAAAFVAVLTRTGQACAAPQQPTPPAKVLCDSECQAALKNVEEVKTSSGLRYKDIRVGKGPIPPTGYQVVADYVAMTPDGRVVDSSLDRGRPYDLRIGAGQIVAGLDEGVASMRAGGLRRVYIPGNLSFPKGLASGPGRPRIPPASPVMFDVELLYIPGLDSEDE